MTEVGYIIGSHVVYNHIALAFLLYSMEQVGIDRRTVVVTVNGSGQEHEFTQEGSFFAFRKGEETSHFAPIVELDLGRRLGITHWLYLNCTSKCGPRFKELVEAGFDPDADATVAAPMLGVNPGKRGKHGRPYNDLAMYRHDFLMSEREFICSQTEMSTVRAHREMDYEGALYSFAPRQASYPNITYTQSEGSDIYGTGTNRITEYFGAIDWYRYKKNWGQLNPGTYKNAVL